MCLSQRFMQQEPFPPPASAHRRPCTGPHPPRPFQSFHHHLQVARNEAVEARSTNAGIDTRCVGARTSVTPGNNTKQSAGRSVDDWAARVTLARVLAASGKTGAVHVGGDGRRAVRGLARRARDDGNVDLAQSGGNRGSALGCNAPVAS